MGEERFREEGEMAQKKIGRKEKGRKKIGRRENQHEKGEGRMSLKNVT